MTDEAGRDLLKIDERLFAAKQRVDIRNQEIARYFYPERADFLGTMEEDAEICAHLMDAYPVRVRRELGDQLGSMSRPSDREWFKNTTSNPDINRRSDASGFLEFMTTVNRSILYSRDSGYVRAAKACEHDFSAFGMGWVQCSYNRARDNLLFRCHHPKLMVGEEGPDGNVWHVHRKADMTARSMAYWFGEDKLPQKAKDALRKNDDKTKFKLRHVFIPLEKYSPYRKFPAGAKWADVYVTEDGKILQELPSFTFDYIVPRWQMVSSFYAMSPATIIALPDARMLQRMALATIDGAEKANDPPIVAVEDAITSPIDLGANGVTFLDAMYDERLGPALRVLELGKNPGVGLDTMQGVKASLADAFYINKLSPMAAAQRSKTAYETSQIVSEYIRNALPLFEPIESEWCGATLELVTEKVMRAGGYGPLDRNMIPVDMPESLLGANLTFEFNNSLKEARDRQTINAYHESVGLVAEASQLDPNIGAEIDLRKGFRDAFGAVPGGRSDWLVGDEEAVANRQAAAQAQQGQQQMQELGGVAALAEQGGNAAQAIQGALANG